jgi:isopenicillin N synthase-like dioxygenase
MAGANDYDVAAALAEFHESRGGVRGLVESGITAVPRLFLAPAAPATPQPQPAAAADFALPTVDLSLPRSDAIKLVQAAARSCGFFHVINHGVPAGTIDAAVSAARAFHEQPLAERSAFYSLEPVGSVTYSTIPHPSNKHHQDAPPLPWRDSLRVRFGPPEPDLSRLPAACRDALQEYQRSLTGFGKAMAGLLSEALDVEPERLERAMQVEGWLMACHYYPPCPESARVVGSLEHTDPSLFTVLAQDAVGGLQVRLDDDAGSEGVCVDVATVTGALLVNIGDVLKVCTFDVHLAIRLLYYMPLHIYYSHHFARYHFACLN